jgi:hypothetical protein
MNRKRVQPWRSSLSRPPRKPSASSRAAGLRSPAYVRGLRAGLSTFDLSRYMGASLTMIDRPYGHLARGEREHAI